MKASAASHRIEALLDTAEYERRCAFATNQNDRMMLRRRVAKAELISPKTGIYVRHGYWDRLNAAQRYMHLIRTEAEKNPNLVFDSFSAAQVYGLNVSYRQLNQICTAPSPKRGGALDATSPTITNQRGLDFWNDVDSDQILVVKGIKVVSPQLAVANSLLGIRLPDGLAIADSALRSFGISNDQLMESVEEIAAGHHGIESARLTVGYADARAESGGESVARGRIIEEGFAVPSLQQVIDDPVDPLSSYRVDFFWPLKKTARSASGVIGELDGMIKYQDESILKGASATSVLVDERQRESHLTLCGYPVVRFLAKRLYEPGYMTTLLEAAKVPRR